MFHCLTQATYITLAHIQISFGISVFWPQILDGMEQDTNSFDTDALIKQI